MVFPLQIGIGIETETVTVTETATATAADKAGQREQAALSTIASLWQLGW